MARGNIVSDAPKSMYDYQCEEDVRTLTRAAEVMADTTRKRKALQKFKAQSRGTDKLIGVLSGHAASKMKGRY